MRYSFYVSETGILDNIPVRPFRMLIVARPGSGKTSYAVREVTRQCAASLTLVDTLAAGRQLSAETGIPFHCSSSPLPRSTPHVISVYNHAALFISADRLLIVDEAHSIISQLGFREGVLSELKSSFSAFQRVILLTGTPIASPLLETFDVYHLTPVVEPERPITLLRYSDRAVLETLAKTIAAHVGNGHQVGVYLPSVGKRLEKLVALLEREGIKEDEITQLNSVQLNAKELDIDCDVVIRTQRFETKVLITTFAQSYNLLNENVVWIVDHAADYVSAIQSLARVRPQLAKAIIMSNACNTKEDDEATTFNQAWLSTGGIILEEAIEQLVAQKKFVVSERKSLLIKPSSFELDFDGIAYTTVQRVTELCRTDLSLLKDTYAQFGYRITRATTSKKEIAEVKGITKGKAKSTVTKAPDEMRLMVNKILSSDFDRIAASDRKLADSVMQLRDAGASRDEIIDIMLNRPNAWKAELLRFKIANDVSEVAREKKIEVMKIFKSVFYSTDKYNELLAQLHPQKKIANSMVKGVFEVKRTHQDGCRGYQLTTL